MAKKHNTILAKEKLVIKHSHMAKKHNTILAKEKLRHTQMKRQNDFAYY